jgi:hypothetical protein
MGVTFSATQTSNNKILLVQRPAVGMDANASQSKLPYTQDLENLINEKGYIMINIDNVKINNYIQNKFKTNIEMIKNAPQKLEITNATINFQSNANILFALMAGFAFTNQYLFIPVIKPSTQNQTNASFIIPQFYFDKNLNKNFNTLLQSFNSGLSSFYIPRINSFINTITTSNNPKLSFLKLVAIGILSYVIMFINPQRLQVDSSLKDGDKFVYLYVLGDIVTDILNLINDSDSSCSILKQVLNFDESLCNSSISSENNNLLIYGLAGTSIFLLIVLIIVLIMR